MQIIVTDQMRIIDAIQLQIIVTDQMRIIDGLIPSTMTVSTETHLFIATYNMKGYTLVPTDF